MTTAQSETDALLPWPDYRTLNSAIFPDWFKASVLELVAAYPDKLKACGIDFWFTSTYDDNTHVQPHAAPYLFWEDNGERPSEDELDHIPGMRRMDRLGDSLIPILGVEADLEGNMLHAVEFAATREGLFYTQADDCDNTTNLTFRCTSKDGTWVCEAVVGTYLDELESSGLSETSLISGDPVMIMGDIDPSAFELTSWPALKDFIRDEDDNIDLVFDLEEFLNVRESQNED